MRMSRICRFLRRLQIKIEGGDGRGRYICGESFRETIIERVDDRLLKDRLFLDSTLTIEMLARIVGTNRTYLSQSISMQKGMTFCEYINSFRIEYAKSYIRENINKGDTGSRTQCSFLSTDDIAFASGFGSKRNFVRQFRRQAGVTPMQYMKSLNSSYI